MTTVGLAVAYERFHALLAEFGHPEAAYRIGIDVWNHRQQDDRAAVVFHLSAHIPDVVLVYAAPTLDIAFDKMRTALQTRAVMPAWEPPVVTLP